MLELIKQNLIEHGPELFKRLLRGTAILFAIYFVGKYVVNKIEAKIRENSLKDEDIYTIKISKLVGSVVMTAFIVFDALAVFQVIGFDMAILMGGISLGIGFAMETIISNMVSGIMILTNKKLNIGDFVQFFGKLNVMGTVEEINIRYSIIRTFDKRRIVVPNNVIAKSPMKTFKTEPLVRGEVNIRLPRHVDFDQVRSIVLETINNIDGVLHKEFSTMFIGGFDKYGINTKAFFFACPQKGKGPFIVKRNLWKNLLEVFRKYGIKVPYEHMTITME